MGWILIALLYALIFFCVWSMLSVSAKADRDAEDSVGAIKGRVSDDDVLYHPKGGMCINCAKLTHDCSKLPFGQMTVIRKSNRSVIVKCSEYQQQEDQS